MLSSIEVRKGLAAGSTPIIVMIESASGVLSSLQIMTAAKRVESVIYAGGEDGDMNVSLGATWSSDGPEMMFVRAVHLRGGARREHQVSAGRRILEHQGPRGIQARYHAVEKAGVPRAHRDPSFSNRSGQPDLYADRRRDRLRHACLKAFDDALARGTASTTVDGKLVDVAMAKTASNILALVKSIEDQNRPAHL